MGKGDARPAPKATPYTLAAPAPQFRQSNSSSSTWKASSPIAPSKRSSFILRRAAAMARRRRALPEARRCCCGAARLREVNHGAIFLAEQLGLHVTLVADLSDGGAIGFGARPFHLLADRIRRRAGSSSGSAASA